MAQIKDSANRESKRVKLREVMDQLGLGALLLERAQNFAWYTGGADNRVDHASPFGVASVLITGDSEYILTTNIEALRMREEQMPDLEVIDYPWQGDRVTAIRQVSGGPLGSDFSTENESRIAPLRYVLDADATERYRRVGADTAAAMAEAADSLEAGMNEHEAAANLAAACRSRGLFTPVLLAAADERIASYRHPIPVGETFERRVMLVVCAERGGLYANLTRMVEFVEPDEETERRQKRCEEILRHMRGEATRPGRSLADAFTDCQRYYAEAGFPDEWRLHHQGGMTGYASREIIATPETEQKIEVGQAFAWNPSITGAKTEETFILTGSGPEVITNSPGV